jgi:hypothetical protein
MFRTILATAALVVTIGTSGAAYATRASEEAEDRFTEGLLSVEYGAVLAGAASAAPPAGPMLLDNPGNARAIVLGCEDACRSARVRLRVAGLPELVASGGEGTRRTVVMSIPRNYARSLSNLEVQIEVDCGNADACAHQWAVLASGSRVPATLRGQPRPITDAQWNAATDLRPQWAARPTAEDMRFYYPVNSWRLSRAGSARLQCLVGANGALQCRVQEEVPSSQGFGDAALRLATLLRVSATDQNGQSTAGRRVTVPISFQPAGS